MDLVPFHCASRRTSTLPKGALGRAMMAGLFSLLAIAPGEAATPPRQTKSIPRPFEVSASPAGNYLAALSAGAQRDTAAAATYFREVLRSDPRNPELIERAFVASLANGNMNDAFSLAERLVARDKNNGLAHLVLGVKAFKAKQFSNARGALSKSGTNRQRDITAILLNAWSYVGSNDYKRAIETVEQLRDPRFAGFRDYHAALIADLSKNTAEAGRRMKAAWEAEKNTLRVVDAYGRFLSRQGQFEEAKKVFRAYDDVVPRHPIVTAALATLDQNKPLPATVRNSQQGAAEVLYGLGAAGTRQGDELASVIYLRLSQHLDAENALAIITLAGLYEQIKQNEIAIDIYESMPENSPLRSNADIQIGLLLEALGRAEEAEKHLAAITVANPKDIEAFNALGNLQRTRKEFGKAAETYTKVIELSPPNERSLWPIYYFRAISYERQKIWPKAEADFLKALELFPNQPLVLNYLGYSWVDQGVRLEEAFRMLQKAVELRPTDGYIVDSLGWAHYKLGRYDEALRELERAVELKPGDPTINDHLGDVYWKVGRKLEAGFQWNHARDLNPEPEDLPRILEKIKNGMPDDVKPAAAAEQPKNGG
jgi:tetratricopeptide (TPR) repeat protein